MREGKKGRGGEGKERRVVILTKYDKISGTLLILVIK